MKPFATACVLSVGIALYAVAPACGAAEARTTNPSKARVTFANVVRRLKPASKPAASKTPTLLQAVVQTAQPTSEAQR